MGCFRKYLKVSKYIKKFVFLERLGFGQNGAADVKQ
jgi:hypothetical protein